MNYQALLNSLKRKVVSPLYLFWGEETFLRDEVLNKFKYDLIPAEVRDFNMDLVDGRSILLDEVVNLASTLPFMSDRRVIIVENADFFGPIKRGGKEKKDRLKGQEEKLLEYLKQPVETTSLIFVSDGVDRKKKVFKALQENGFAVEFAPLKNIELNSWVENRARLMGKNIEDEAVAELVTAIGSNLRMLDSELQKLTSFIGDRMVINREDVLELVSKTTDLTIFELTDSVGARDYEKAIKIMRELVIYGEPPIRLLFMVAKHFRTLLQVKALKQAGFADKQVASQLQIHPYVAQKCVRQAKNFSRTELESALERILETDLALKTSSKEPLLALELLFIQLCERKVG